MDANTFTRNDYDFIGWNRNSHATAIEYSDMQNVSFNDDTILYAIWTPKAKPIVGGKWTVSGSLGSIACIAKTHDYKTGYWTRDD